MGSAFFCGMSTGTISSASLPEACAARSFHLRTIGECILVFTADLVLRRQVFSRSPHAIGAIKGFHPWIDKPPAKAAVMHFGVPAEGLGYL